MSTQLDPAGEPERRRAAPGRQSPPGRRSTPSVRPERRNHQRGRLVLFDLDHTLLAGDSDVLWCDFLIAKGALDAGFAKRNADIEVQYQDGSVDPVVFANFYVSTLAGRTPHQWEPLRRQFLSQEILPRIPAAAFELVDRHRNAGDLVVMTTATNRFIAEPTAAHLRIEHLIATEPELVEGVFTGATTGVLNMRFGKVARLHDWLQARGTTLGQFVSTGYSDSINDRPLLEAVDQAVAVNPDPRLAALAARNGWTTLLLH